MRYAAPSRRLRRGVIGGTRDPEVVAGRQSLGATANLTPGAAHAQNPQPPGQDHDPPAGWRIALDDDFTTAFQTHTGLDPAKWKNTTFGGQAHCNPTCSAVWDGGDGISVQGGNCVINVRNVGGTWWVTGFLEGQSHRWATWDQMHPGYHEFHIRFRARMSPQFAPGIGYYVLLYPWHTDWTTEMDIVEVPAGDTGGDHTRVDATMHWDNMDGHDWSPATVYGVPQGEWHQYDFRRTYRVVDGRPVADIQMWIDGQKVTEGGETPWMWEGNAWLTEPMIFGAATYVSSPFGTDAWYGAVTGQTPNSCDAFIDRVRIWVPEPEPGSQAVQRLDIGVRGQSNAWFAISFGAAEHMRQLVQQLTGIPQVNLIAALNVTAVGGTYTLNLPNNQDAWLVGSTNTDPSTWTLSGIGQGCVDHYVANRSSDPEHPFIDVVLHWEYDLLHWQAENQNAYPGARRRLNQLVRQALGKAPGKHVIVNCECPYQGSVQSEMLDIIRQCWAEDEENPNAYVIRGQGCAFDGDHQGDFGHWVSDLAFRAARRWAIAIARYCFLRGWTNPNRDLRWLPGIGPRIGHVSRAASNALYVHIQHDRGTRLVIPSGFNPGLFHIEGTDLYGTGVQFVGGSDDGIRNKLLVTFDGTIPSGTLRLLYAYWPDYLGPDGLITDNWHTSAVSKPPEIADVTGVATVPMPLARTERGVSFS